MFSETVYAGWGATLRESLVLKAILAGFTALAVLATLPAKAQELWPAKRVTVIVPYPAGGYIDAVARLLSDGLRQTTGQQFVVINKSGGNGRIGLGDLVKSEPDGYTLLVNNDGGIGIPPAVDPTFPFSYKDGYTPIVQAVEAQYLMAVKAGLPVRTLNEFVGYAKSNPGKLNYGSSGIASTPHVSAAYLASHFKLDMVHVPYQGAAPVLNDFLAGVTDLYLPSIASIAGHLTNPSVRFLATLGPGRVSVLPDDPTMAELGVKEMTMVGWLGVFGPPNLPVGLRDQISNLVEKLMVDPEQQTKFRAIFADPVTKPGREFSPFYQSEVEKWKAFAERTGFKVAPQ